MSKSSYCIRNFSERDRVAQTQSHGREIPLIEESRESEFRPTGELNSSGHKLKVYATGLPLRSIQ